MSGHPATSKVLQTWCLLSIKGFTFCTNHISQQLNTPSPRSPDNLCSPKYIPLGIGFGTVAVDCSDCQHLHGSPDQFFFKTISPTFDFFFDGPPSRLRKWFRFGFQLQANDTFVDFWSAQQPFENLSNDARGLLHQIYKLLMGFLSFKHWNKEWKPDLLIWTKVKVQPSGRLTKSDIICHLLWASSAIRIAMASSTPVSVSMINFFTMVLILIFNKPFQSASSKLLYTSTQRYPSNSIPTQSHPNNSATPTSFFGDGSILSLTLGSVCLWSADMQE